MLNLSTRSAPVVKIFDAIPMPVLVVDRRRRVVAANDDLLRGFGLKRDKPAERLLSKICASRAPGGDFRALLERAISEGRTFKDHELDIDLPRLGRRKFLVSGSRLRGPTPDGDCAILVFQDATRSALQDARSKAQTAALVDLNGNLENFAGIAARDLLPALNRAIQSAEAISRRMRPRVDRTAPADESSIGTGHDGLTGRERETLILIAEGLSNKAIAGALKIGLRTVETHRHRLMMKLDVRSSVGLARYALSHGMIALK
jgi:DNA-binding CsgD family transcriptional regulator